MLVLLAYDALAQGDELFVAARLEGSPRERSATVLQQPRARRDDTLFLTSAGICKHSVEDTRSRIPELKWTPDLGPGA